MILPMICQIWLALLLIIVDSAPSTLNPNPSTGKYLVPDTTTLVEAYVGTEGVEDPVFYMGFLLAAQERVQSKIFAHGADTPTADDDENPFYFEQQIQGNHYLLFSALAIHSLKQDFTWQRLDDTLRGLYRMLVAWNHWDFERIIRIHDMSIGDRVLGTANIRVAQHDGGGNSTNGDGAKMDAGCGQKNCTASAATWRS